MVFRVASMLLACYEEVIDKLQTFYEEVKRNFSRGIQPLTSIHESRHTTPHASPS